MDMDFVKSENLLHIHLAEKLDISNLFLNSRLVSDILSKQECVRRSKSCRDDMVIPDSKSAVMESQELTTCQSKARSSGNPGPLIYGFPQKQY